MSDEASIWLHYARENLQVAHMTLEAGLLNPCLQFVRSYVEFTHYVERLHSDATRPAAHEPAAEKPEAQSGHEH